MPETSDLTDVQLAVRKSACTTKRTANAMNCLCLDSGSHVLVRNVN